MGRGEVYPVGNLRSRCLQDEELVHRVGGGRRRDWRDKPLGNLFLERPKFLAVLCFKAQEEVQVLSNPTFNSLASDVSFGQFLSSVKLGTGC